MILNILVFDDNLGALLDEVTQGLSTYVGREVTVPDFKIGDTKTLHVEAMPGHISVDLAFVANSAKIKSGRIVAELIRSGHYDKTIWDAVIVDNNWNVRDLSNADGCEHILPALLESGHFKKCKPEYLLFTWHFNDNTYHSVIGKELAGLRGSANIRPIAKGERHHLSQWFSEMISARTAARLRPEIPNVSEAVSPGEDNRGQTGKSPPKKYPVVVSPDGTFKVNGQSPPDTPGRRIKGSLQRCLTLLFFLGYHHVPVRRSRDVMDCKAWLKDKLEGKTDEQCIKGGLTQEILSALKKVSACDANLITDSTLSDENARNAWDAFRTKFKCGASRKGAGGDAPYTILRSITIKSFGIASPTKLGI